MQARSDLQMFASFRLGEAELAISISSLQEVVNFPEAVTKVPLAPPFLMGLFNLRGMVTPIVDMGRLLNIETAPSENRKVAIVSINKVRIGLLFDSTSEILNLKSDEISWFGEDLLQGRKSVVSGVLKLSGGDRIVEVIDPNLLLKIENIPQILDQNKNNSVELMRKNSKRGQCITFKTGKLEFGIAISAISEIIKVPEIKKSVLAVDHCVGLVNLRGSVIPILDFHKVLKMESDDQRDVESNRIVILKLDQIQVGFMVDSVDSIVTFFEEDILPIPLFKQERIDMLKGLLTNKSGVNVILLNEKNILSSDEVHQITKGHEALYGKNESQEADRRKASERRPYLTFRLKFLFTTQLSGVDEIAKMNHDMIRPPGYPEYVVGVLNTRGQLVMVLDLRRYYGIEPLQDSTNARILVVRGQNSKFGLVVDDVEAINTLDESQKIKMPNILAQDAEQMIQGDMQEVVEMADMNGQKKTFMIFDVISFIQKFESKTTSSAA